MRIIKWNEASYLNESYKLKPSQPFGCGLLIKTKCVSNMTLWIWKSIYPIVWRGVVDLKKIKWTFILNWWVILMCQRWHEIVLNRQMTIQS